jgi:hypothetical protein
MAKVLAGVPTRGGVHEMTTAFMAHLARRADVCPVLVKGRPEDFVRNNLVRTVLAAPATTHLFIMDSDTEPPRDVLDRLLALDVPIASGCYPLLMRNGLRWSLANKDSDGRYRLLEWLPSDEQPFEVDAGGAGCLLITREVFEKIKWPWFHWIERKDGSQLSEDIYFFRKCNRAGLRVLVDPQVVCNHYKTINLTALMRAKMKAKQ